MPTPEEALNRHRTFAPLAPLPSHYLNALGAFLSTALSNFKVQIKGGAPTVLQVPANIGNILTCITVEGRWRYNSSAVEIASPGGAARTLDLYVTASDNVVVPGDIAETDTTNYDFGLAFTETGVELAPGPLRRLVARAVWDGTQFTAVDNLVGAWSGTSRHAAAHATGAADAIAPSSIGAASAGSVTPVGSIVDYGGSSDPAGGVWLICDGRSLLRADYPSLFTALGGSSSPWGLPDGTHFNLPDLRGRTTVGVDGAAARLTANDTLGASGGAEKHQLTTGELPAHSHSTLYNGTMVVNAGASWTIPLYTAPGATGSVGSDQPHNNMQPYVVTNKIIRAL